MQKLIPNKVDESGPFDIIGDIHGCYDELQELLSQLGYFIQEDLIFTESSAVQKNDQRQVIFLGDLMDRGPRSKQVLGLVMNMVHHDLALCVLGNHDAKFNRFLKGKAVKLTHGLEMTAKEFEYESEENKAKIIAFIDHLTSHYVLDHGKLVVAHAGLKEELQGKDSGKALHFALYGDITGERDEMNLPIRRDWAKEYTGSAMVVYGHTPVKEAEWINNTICIDTGCVFGGKLTALRYPEKELVSVAAKKKYYLRHID